MYKPRTYVLPTRIGGARVITLVPGHPALTIGTRGFPMKQGDIISSSGSSDYVVLSDGNDVITAAFNVETGHRLNDDGLAALNKTVGCADVAGVRDNRLYYNAGIMGLYSVDPAAPGEPRLENVGGGLWLTKFGEPLFHVARAPGHLCISVVREDKTVDARLVHWSAAAQPFFIFADLFMNRETRQLYDLEGEMPGEVYRDCFVNTACRPYLIFTTDAEAEYTLYMVKGRKLVRPRWPGAVDRFTCLRRRVEDGAVLISDTRVLGNDVVLDDEDYAAAEADFEERQGKRQRKGE